MPRLTLAALCAAVAASALTPVVPSASASPAEPALPAAQTHVTSPAAKIHSAIDRRLERAIRRRMAGSTASEWSAVVDIAHKGRVAEIHPALAMRPASTEKLFTTIPLLAKGRDRRLHTRVLSTALPVHGVVTGDLVVRAGADPSLRHPDLVDLAHKVRASGIRSVTGALQLDIGSLPMLTKRSGWLKDFVPDEVGPLSPFPVKQDSGRKDAAYLDHPTSDNLRQFRHVLAHHGVTVDGGSAIVRSDGATHVVAQHRSAPVWKLVGHTLRISDNFNAETFYSRDGGRDRITRLTHVAGITDKSYTTDGSGLSYRDRQTTRGEVTLLHYARRHQHALRLKSELPVACRTGTLRHRLCHTSAAGKVFAKTGTLSHTTALTGWTTDARGRRVTFSVITMGTSNTYAAEAATDQVVLKLRAYHR